MCKPNIKIKTIGIPVINSAKIETNQSGDDYCDDDCDDDCEDQMLLIVKFFLKTKKKPYSQKHNSLLDAIFAFVFSADEGTVADIAEQAKHYTQHALLKTKLKNRGLFESLATLEYSFAQRTSLTNIKFPAKHGLSAIEVHLGKKHGMPGAERKTGFRSYHAGLFAPAQRVVYPDGAQQINGVSQMEPTKYQMEPTKWSRGEMEPGAGEPKVIRFYAPTSLLEWRAFAVDEF